MVDSQSTPLPHHLFYSVFAIFPRCSLVNITPSKLYTRSPHHSPFTIRSPCPPLSQVKSSFICPPHAALMHFFHVSLLVSGGVCRVLVIQHLSRNREARQHDRQPCRQTCKKRAEWQPGSFCSKTDRWGGSREQASEVEALWDRIKQSG